MKLPLIQTSLGALLVGPLFLKSSNALIPDSGKRNALSRRDIFSAVPLLSWAALQNPSAAIAEDGGGTSGPISDLFRNRDRKMNQNALIREDYWYMMGKTPPRLLTGPLQGDDPQWNAFGTCVTSGGTNSCTYVSLNQRIPAYSKYGFAISNGGRDYRQLGQVLNKLCSTKQIEPIDPLWTEAARLVAIESGSVPPPLVDAELKMILLATALLTSPNFPIPSRELLVARYYANEAHYTAGVLRNAILENKDPKQAREAWEYGRDAWNSYFQIVNRSITAKVGDPFELIA